MDSNKMIGFYSILFMSIMINKIEFCIMMDNYLLNNQNKLNNLSKMDRSSVFRQTSLLVCLPDLMQLHCPIHMYIRTLEAEMFHSIRTIQEPEFISPSCSFKTSQIEKKRKHELNIKQVTECNHKLNIIKVIQQMCEGRKNCELQLSQLIPNLTQCFEDNSSLLVKYQCLPDLNSALFEAICTDTYMEVKCNTERSINALVILNAKFEKEIKPFDRSSTYECPIVPTEIPIGLSDNVCSSTIDITDYLSNSCDGHSSCSVNPNTIDLSMNKIQKCGKMHLSLVYVCVPPELIITKHFINTNNERHTEKQKTIQRQPKEIQTVRSSNKIHTLNPSDVSPYEKSQPSFMGADIEPNKKKLSMDLRKSMNVHMNSKTTELLHKNQDPYIPSFNPSILQSSLIGFGSGLFILLCILFIVILIYRKYNNKHTEMKSQHASKSNECSTICFSHSNDDWSTINSKGLHMTSITEIPLPNDIKFLCPICKLPTNPCSMITDLHKYHNENCQCHINSNTVGNLNICALHHETFDSKPCCMTGHHHDNSSDLYTMKIITPTLNQSPCMFNVCPLDITNDLNSIHHPLSTNTMNSGNSRNTITDYIPTVTSSSSIHSIHYEYHRSPTLDPKCRSDLTSNIIEETVYNTNNNICNFNYINTSQSINSSHSTGYGYDIGNGINEHRLHNTTTNSNNSSGNNIITDHCQYDMKTINLRNQNEIINNDMIRSPSNHFTDQMDYQQRIVTTTNNNSNSIDIDNCIESLEKYGQYNESRSVYEINSPLKSKLEHQMDLNPQRYGCITITNDKQHPYYQKEINEMNYHSNKFIINNSNSINQRCNSLGNESIESLAISLIDPPQNFRTSNNELHLNTTTNNNNTTTTNNNSNISSIKVTLTSTYKPPDVILKSGNYHDEMDLERPPPKMPPLRGILTNKICYD
uniref:Protein kinase domain-containing protein n=1 Tax=Schistosoma mansoni TaxID=6183 RepID=A0A5K4FGH8_SCHMA